MPRKMTKLALATAMALMASTAVALEPGVPAAMPSGATMGVPVGANFPVPGLYLNTGTAVVRGTIYDDDGKETDNDLSLNVVAVQLSWTPGIELWGGTYRSAVTLAYQDIETSNGGTTTGENKSISDIVVSPLNIHWALAPGIFATSGVSINFPTGEFIPVGPGAEPSGGQGAHALGLSAGISYLRDGWNLSLHGNYFLHGENDETDYRSGDQIVLNWTAMKAVGDTGWNAGAVGYLRKQVTDDENNGDFYFGQVAGRAEEHGIGVAVSKRFGPAVVAADYTKNISAKNTDGIDQFRLNVSIPIGG